MDQMKLDEKIKGFAENNPKKIAINYGLKNITYSQLENKSNFIANFLIDNFKESKNVFVMMKRSDIFVEALVGTIKSGGIFIPIDDNIPTEKFLAILNEIQLDVIITTTNFLHKLNDIAKKSGELMNTLVLDLNVENNQELSKFENLNILMFHNYKPKLSMKYEYCQNKHCYIYFTSGSTGKPKAVLGRYRSLMHFITWEINEFAIDSDVKVSQLIYAGFDALLRDVLVPLCSGGTLYIPENQDIIFNSTELVNWIERKKITLIHTVPSVFKVMSNQVTHINELKSLKYILLSGEMLRGCDIKNFINVFGNRIQLVNLYGTTETTLIKLFYRIKVDDINKATIPVGKPIHATEVLILNKDFKRCANEITGEIYIRTPFITSGYCNDKEYTKKVFIKNPFSNNANDIIYKTGDLGRRLDDGNIEVIGREDEQVKIRGMRIELGEIENVILQNELIRDAVVVTKEDTDGDKYICAYIVADTEINISAIRIILSEKLPSYMIPSYFIQIRKMPLTPNGKTDRMALKKLNVDTNIIDIKKDYEAPITEIEKTLENIWKRVLKMDRVGINNNFFELGGHSLKAATLISKIHSEMDFYVPMSKIFECPTIKELSKYISSLEKNLYIPIQVAEEREFYPLTFLQTGIYSAQMLDENSTSYNMPLVIKFNGEIDREVIEKIFIEIVMRQEALRTSFKFIEDKPVQTILKHIAFKMDYDVVSDSEDMIVNNYIRPFDMGKAPLIRVGLFKQSHNKHILIVDMHHIISDGVSVAIIIKEFCSLYKGERLLPLDITYKDYIVWKEHILENECIIQQERYWLNRLNDGIPYFNIPTDYPRPEILSFNGDKIHMMLEESIKDKLKKICKESNSTLYMILLAAYNILLFNYTGQETIIVGSSIANRQHEAMANIVGMFINILPMKNRVNKEGTFKEFLFEVRKNSIEAYKNQDYPFQKIVKNVVTKRDVNRNPIFDTMFDVQNMEFGSNDLKCIEIEPYFYKDKTSKADIVVSIIEIEDGINVITQYNTNLFKKETILRFQENYKEIIKKIIENINIKIEDLNILEITREKVLTDGNKNHELLNYGNLELDEQFNF